MLKYILGMATALVASGAFAEPLVGSTLVGQGFMCDTDAQVHALYDAGAKDETGAALSEEYQHLNALRNDKDEPACLYGGISGVNIVSVTPLGRVKLRELTYDVWLVNIVGFHDLPGSILFPEVVAVEAAPSEAPKSDDPK